jgi:signal transduction histidine kinase
MKRPPASTRPLLHSIAIRLALVALGLIGAMSAVTVVEYVGDVEKLRRATLETQTKEIFSWLRSGQLPDFVQYCERYPKAYGYRIFDDKNEIITQINGDLFAPMPRYRSGRPDLAFQHKPSDDPWKDQWLITRGEIVNGAPIWIHATLVGDPAALWREVVVHEVVRRVVLPSIVIVPALSVAIFLALRSALRPLNRIAQRARDLAAEVDSGAPLYELRTDDLPREAIDLAAAINILLRKLESMLAQQRQFTDNAAHELRTPLATLLLQISCLPASEPVERLKADIAVMRRLVDQLLRLSQAEQLAKAGFRRHDLREIARAACEEMALLATEQDRLLELVEPSRPVFVSCNDEFIQIAIRNIIENAVHASPAGASVSILVNELAEVTVADCGPGIPDAEKPLVFQRCWTQRRRSGAGAGIGLALVQRIVDLHAGATRIEDRKGGGAQVTLSLRTARLQGADPDARHGGAHPVEEDSLGCLSAASASEQR